MSQPGHTIEKYKVIEIFAMQLIHQPIEFRPKELFTINNQHIFEVRELLAFPSSNELIFQVITTIILYDILLLQFYLT